MNVTDLMTNSLKEHPEQRNFFLPIPAKEWPEFVNGIDLNGIIVPLFVSARDGVTVLDGHQRLTAAKELGLETVPVVIREFETEADEVAFMVTVNDGRRHDSTETRTNRADYFLRKYAGKSVSDYEVAAKAGVNRKTAQRRRKQLEAEGEIPAREVVIGRDGRTRTANPSTRASALVEPVASHDATLKPANLTPNDETDEGHEYPTEFPTDDGPELPTFTPSKTYKEVSDAVALINRYNEGQLLQLIAEEPHWYPVPLARHFGYAVELLTQVEVAVRDNTKNAKTPLPQTPNKASGKEFN
jgi:ParB-like chromosome segregation protein Spo0J